MGLFDWLFRTNAASSREAAALTAVAAARDERDGRSRETEPEAWADAQFELARALRAYGEVRQPRGVTAAESEAEAAARIAPFLEAEAPLRAALEVLTRERAPDRWADLQQELARQLRRVGEIRYDDPSLLEAAADAARAAVAMRTRERAPEAWLESQLELAEILFDSASNTRPGSQELYDAAVAAFRTAAASTAYIDRSRSWAWTRSRLALALMHAGSMTDAPAELRQAMLREAVQVAREAEAWAAGARDKALASDARGVADYAETFLQMHEEGAGA
ncbi:hypothetical protein [Caulobacter sp. 17J80-11]|uniref:hypothetical protein n=1 Tax=Caulobacter sp. 17J80-11 TaxID=2763502 RepID=UPI001653526B|nr:hypothetical protein [Caulobacter sp. 17J80-11]MBC6980894.1 hypothetical protein [Caulobacter sp. 17J80-11]